MAPALPLPPTFRQRRRRFVPSTLTIRNSPLRLSTILTGLLQEGEAWEDFEMDPEKTSAEDEILEQTICTLERVVFDCAAWVLPLGYEQEVGDDMDDDNTFSDEDSIVVAKRRREQRRAWDERDNKCAGSHSSSSRIHHLLGDDQSLQAAE